MVVENKNSEFSNESVDPHLLLTRIPYLPERSSIKPVLGNIFDANIIGLAISALQGTGHQRSTFSRPKQKKAYRSRRLSTDGIDPVNLIRDISGNLSDPQPVDIIGRINRRRDRCNTRSDEKCVFFSLELLSRSEVPDRREPGSNRIRDEVMIGLDDFGGQQGGDDGGDFLNGDVARDVNPGIVNGLLDRREKFWRRVVQA